jgi:hypothetical protein
MRFRIILSTALMLFTPSPPAESRMPDLLANAEADRPPYFEQVLNARFDQPDRAEFDRLRTWAERPTAQERARYMVKIGTGPDDTSMWRDRIPCWEADRKYLTRAMVVAAGNSTNRAMARRVWAEAKRSQRSVPRIEHERLTFARSELRPDATEIAKALAVRHARDQAWRVAQFEEAHDEVTAEVISWLLSIRGCRIDYDNLKYVRRVVVDGRWPLISRDGEDAARYAFLLVQHADDDPDFQEQVLTLMRPLVARREANGKYYAMLFDRVALTRHRPQRYGTQFGSGNGCIAVRAVEDHNTLDARRASVGLAPLQEYARSLAETYHEKICSDVFAVAETVP